MATFYSYAEVLTDDSPQSRLFASGRLPSRPGRPLREYIEDGGYEMQLPLLDDMRAQLRRAAQLTGDKSLLAMADTAQVTISLEHLRGLDPETRIVCGVGVRYTEQEAKALQLADPDSAGPAGQIVL
jgi:hypothetical protein